MVHLRHNDLNLLIFPAVWPDRSQNLRMCYEDRAQKFFEVVAFGLPNDDPSLTLDLVYIPFWHGAHKFLELRQETTPTMCGHVGLCLCQEFHKETAKGRRQKLYELLRIFSFGLAVNTNTAVV